MRLFLMSMLLLGLIVGVFPALGDEKKKDQAPAEALLARLEKEMVLITPGKGKFPAKVVIKEKNGERTLTVDHEFSIGIYEVPQNVFMAVMERNPSRWKGTRNAVDNVSYDQAVEFCRRATKKLRRMKKLTDNEELRLPTADEWEYACRAGATGAYSFGEKVETLGQYAWYTKNAAGNDPPVGAKKPNAWGLYDMHGYIWEWCVSKQPVKDDDQKTDKSSKRMVRGGAWTSSADQCRCDAVWWLDAKTKRPDVGFRVVKVAKSSKAG